MKKKAIQLTVLVGVLILLLIGYVILTSQPNGEEDSTDQIISGTYTVCTVDQNTVHKIAYTRGGVEYAYSLKEDATGWVWSEDPILPLDNLYFANMVTAFTDLTSTVCLTDVTPAQLVEYGLDENADTVRFTDEVNGDKRYRLGIRNSFNGLLYFCNESDLTTVYMVASTVTDPFVYTPYDMIKLPDLPTDITAANLVRVTLTPAQGSVYAPTVYTYYTGGKVEGETDVWYVSRNGAEEIPVDDKTGTSLSTALTTLAFSELVSFKPAEQADFGLDQPTVMTIDYKITQAFQDESTGKTTKVNVDRSFTLLLGDTDTASGLLYATVEDSPLTCKLMGSIFTEILHAATIAG